MTPWQWIQAYTGTLTLWLLGALFTGLVVVLGMFWRNHRPAPDERCPYPLDEAMMTLPTHIILELARGCGVSRGSAVPPGVEHGADGDAVTAREVLAVQQSDSLGHPMDILVEADASHPLVKLTLASVPK